MRKNSTYLFILTIILLSIFLSCSRNRQKQEKDYAQSEEVIQDTKIENSIGNTTNSKENKKLAQTTDNTKEDNEAAISEAELQKIGKKIIKNGEIDIEVDNYSKAIKRLKDTLKTFDCYISEEKETKYREYISNKITIRVKSEQFDNLLRAILAGKGSVSSKTITVNDITEQYIDIYQRLKTKKKVLEQYETYLKKAHTISDILNVTNYMRQIQEEIESAKGKLKYLDNQASYSTLILNISQNKEEISQNNFWEKLTEGLSAGWHGFLSVILGFFYLWPLWIFIVIIIFVIRSIKKKRSKNKTND